MIKKLIAVINEMLKNSRFTAPFLWLLTVSVFVFLQRFCDPLWIPKISPWEFSYAPTAML